MGLFHPGVPYLHASFQELDCTIIPLDKLPDITDLSAQSALPPANPTELEGLFAKEPLPWSADRDLSLTEPPRLPYPPSV